MLLLLLLALPFVGSIAAMFFPVNARNTEAWLASAVSLSAFAIAATYYADVAGGHAVRVDVEWLPSLGLDFTLRLDGYAWMFAMLVTGIGFLVVLYARY